MSCERKMVTFKSHFEPWNGEVIPQNKHLILGMAIDWAYRLEMDAPVEWIDDVVVLFELDYSPCIPGRMRTSDTMEAICQGVGGRKPKAFEWESTPCSIILEIEKEVRFFFFFWVEGADGVYTQWGTCGFRLENSASDWKRLEKEVRLFGLLCVDGDG